ncbi:thioredoxin family protein [Gryllotalpicola sp.]|uniref:glutaredoxin family protein n=1 Tax=Gryllotalpicola sp. TaxID=1932787 RepID=UPI0026141CBE|nr:thioredoxin family protein [Gryllotalpicola sp.]
MVQLTFYSSAFCEPCIRTRAVLEEAERLVPAATLVEHDIVRSEEAAREAGIRVAPTVVVTDSAGREVFRAEGEPSLAQVLVAAAKAL